MLDYQKIILPYEQWVTTEAISIKGSSQLHKEIIQDGSVTKSLDDFDRW